MFENLPTRFRLYKVYGESKLLSPTLGKIICRWFFTEGGVIHVEDGLLHASHEGWALGADLDTQ